MTTPSNLYKVSFARHGTWARVRQVLHREIAPPGVSVKFYKAIVQSVLLYGSKMWVLSKAVL
jgi:hypothetical protein